jgi:hypothetical protein
MRLRACGAATPQANLKKMHLILLAGLVLARRVFTVSHFKV